MPQIEQQLKAIQQRIAAAASDCGRDPSEIQLLAVSKTQPLAALQAAIAAGQRQFGESYVQEAVSKLTTLHDTALQWHFIGPIQSNKTQAIAQHFNWVHSIDRLKIAQRLNQQCPNSRKLHVCIQVNTSGETSKSGVAPGDLMTLAEQIRELPNLCLRGLMTIPAKQPDRSTQRIPFRQLYELQSQLNQRGFGLDTLSMGMTHDLEAAIHEGATLVRVGTGIFGPRHQV